MTQQNIDKTKPMAEQITYANLLSWGVLVGLLMLTVTYVLYLSGLLTPHVETQIVIANWKKGVDAYMAATNSPHGWDWVHLIGKGDFINFIGIALLAGMTIVCYLVLLPGFLRRKERLYAIICVLEVLVLVVAASGILGAGGH